MMKAIIIEDELNSRELLVQLLNNFCENVEVIGVAETATSGIQLVKELQPDLVFLDIEMPGGNGFEVLKAFDPIPFKVIFVSGYDHYAIQAIKYSALDYLLKPVSLDELEEAVAKAARQHHIDKVNVQSLEWNFQDTAKPPDRLVLSNDKGRAFVNLKEVLFIEAEGGYTHFVLEGKRKQIASRSLGYYEELLPPDQFYRVHKSYIVNCQKVVSVNAGRGGPVELIDGSFIPIAFRRKTSFVQLIGLKD